MHQPKEQEGGGGGGGEVGGGKGRTHMIVDDLDRGHKSIVMETNLHVKVSTAQETSCGLWCLLYVI